MSCLDLLLALSAPPPGQESNSWSSHAVTGSVPWLPALMVCSPQVDHAKVLHYIGAGVAFPTSMLFLLLQSILTYRMAKTRGQYWTGHLRSILTTVAFFTLVFSILKGVGKRLGVLTVEYAPHILYPLVRQ